jgi:hypothetical protein
MKGGVLILQPPPAVHLWSTTRRRRSSNAAVAGFDPLRRKLMRVPYRMPAVVPGARGTGFEHSPSGGFESATPLAPFIRKSGPAGSAATPDSRDRFALLAMVALRFAQDENAWFLGAGVLK